MRIVYLNLSADSEPFLSHMKAQQETWAFNIQSMPIWIFGSKSQTSKYHSELHRLELPIEEKFENILAKSIEGIKWALQNLEFDFIVRGNTSNYYDDLVLRDFLSQHLNDKYFAGSELGFTELNNQTPVNTGRYLSGTGIVLSRDAARKMLDIDISNYKDWPDDVAISHHLSMHELPFTRIPRGDITDFKPLTFTTQYRVKSWTDHDHTSERMYKVDKILKSPLYASFIYFIYFNIVEYIRYARYFPILKGLNILRHGRQLYWVVMSVIKYPILKVRHQQLAEKPKY